MTLPTVVIILKANMLTFLRIILAACKDIGRNVWLSFAVVVVMLLTLTTMHGLLVLHALSEQIIASVHQQVDVEVSFLPDTSEDIEKSLRGYVGGFSQVRSVTLFQEMKYWPKCAPITPTTQTS